MVADGGERWELKMFGCSRVFSLFSQATYHYRFQRKQQLAKRHAMALEYCAGQRVSFKSHRCTVRYIGKVEGADPDKIWLGVEWDDQTRGKHNGEYLGQRYFKCMVL